MPQEHVSTRDQVRGSTCQVTHTAQDGMVIFVEDGNSIERIQPPLHTEKPGQTDPVALTDFVALELSQVPEVENVFTAKLKNLVYAWIVVDPFDEAVREEIYVHEKSIIDEFWDFEFDFNIISRRGRKLQELLSDPNTDLTYHRQ